MKGAMFVQGEKWDKQRFSLEFGQQNVHLSFPSLLEIPTEPPVMEKELNTIFVQLENAFPAQGSGGWEAAGGVWGCPCPGQPSLVPSDPCSAGRTPPFHQNWPNCQENENKFEHDRLE